ncbi:PREDICTED: uncharacterized protein LOC104698868 [Camelina sativa]|uniref:Uncharacterized protein LOC104698868 n=1 Tax=Camelina sativa TaxID=90675 RepID=A0ABM0SKP3_CAMSA|nr:PREDICTED: uncharacterized protein LOC104698868 [Camelina sativa]
MQIMWATIMLVLIIVLSKSIETKGNEKVNDLALNALKHFESKKVTKVCCKILLSLPEDCFGTLLPVRWIYDAVLKTACRALGYPK